ncbi:hypothetical protein, partial [Citrobacter freundii]
MDKYTACVLDVVNKIPFIFPKVLSINAKDFHSKSDYIAEKQASRQNIYYVSLFEPPFNWGGISFSMLMDSEELTKLQKWKEKRSRFTPTGRELHIQPKSFDQENGWVNIGLLRINKKSITDDLRPIYIESVFFDGVYITLTKYSTGLAFVTFYIHLNNSTTRNVSAVSVPKIKYFVQLSHLNIYSKKSSSIIIKDYWHHSEDILMSNINQIQKSAVELLTLLMKEMKINKKDDELCCFYDVEIVQDYPYFDVEPRNLSKHHIHLSRRKKFSNAELSKDKFKSFIGKSNHRIKGVDWIYLRVKPRELSRSEKGREKIYLSNSGTHLSIAPFFLMNNKIDKISGYLNELKLHNKKQRLESMHKNLYAISYELKMISAWLLSANESKTFHVPAEYLKTASKIINHNIKRVKKLNEIVSDI